jgi:hypothetical protein
MKRTGWLAALGAAALLAPCGYAQTTRVVTYPVPAGEAPAADYVVHVNGQRAEALTAAVGRPWADAPYDFGRAYAFVQFDFSGSVTVKIHSAGRDLEHAAMRGLSRDLKRTVLDRNTIAITLAGPCQLSVEPDGKKSPLLIFANELEKDPPGKNDPGVIYFGPGIHRPESGVVELKSNQTLYLAGGAILEANVHAQDAENVAIRGRGVLSGNRWEWRKGPGWSIGLRNCRNVTIEGIVVRGAPHWTIVPSGCDHVTIANVKICNVRVQMNDDGINPCNSRRVAIRNCFVRTVDDCIALKGTNYEWGDVDGILVEDTILWCDSARVTLLGHESRAKLMQNIVYRNLEVVHFGGWPVFLLEPSDDMTLRNVRFENIRINGDHQPPRTGMFSSQAQQWFAVIRPAITQYSGKPVWGRIEDVTFKDIELTGAPGKYVILVEGAADHRDRRVRNISFENVTIQGERIIQDSMRLVFGPWLRPATEKVTLR